MLVSGVDESQVTEPDPATLAARLAELKAEAVVAHLAAEHADGDRAGGADGCSCSAATRSSSSTAASSASPTTPTTRASDGAPCAAAPGCSTPATACATWRPAGASSGRVDTVVHFADVSDAEIEAYVASGEPLHVAGAFTIDGLGGAFVRGIEGDPHCVVGVSLPALREMVLELGRSWTDLWQHRPLTAGLADCAACEGSFWPAAPGLGCTRSPGD